MAVKLKRIPVMPLAKMLLCFHTVVGLLLGMIVTIGSLTGAGDEGFWSLGAWSLLLFPLVNAVLGFVTGIFIAVSYNLITERVGGGIAFEFEGEEIPSLSQRL